MRIIFCPLFIQWLLPVTVVLLVIGTEENERISTSLELNGCFFNTYNEMNGAPDAKGFI